MKRSYSVKQPGGVSVGNFIQNPEGRAVLERAATTPLLPEFLLHNNSDSQ